MQMKNERTALMESESRLSNSRKSGSERNFSLHPNCLQRPVTENFIELKIIENHSPRTIRSYIPLL